MAKIFFLVLLCICIETGSAVRLSKFTPLGTEKYLKNLIAFTKVHPATVDMVYFNETFFHSVCVANCSNNPNPDYVVSKTSLISLITTHQNTNSVHSHSFHTYDDLFVLNDRVYMMVTVDDYDDIILTKVLIWEDTEGVWRSLNGNFPYKLGVQDLQTYLKVTFSTDVSNSADTIYFSIGASDSRQHTRYEFFRLKLIYDRIRVDVAAGFTLQERLRLSFFAVRNGRLMALLEDPNGLLKYTMSVSSKGLARHENSSDIAIDPVPGLRDTIGYRVGDFAVFKRYSYGESNLQILDLNTMEITPTDVNLRSTANCLTDEIGGRFFVMNRHQRHEVAILTV